MSRFRRLLRRRLLIVAFASLFAVALAAPAGARWSLAEAKYPPAAPVAPDGGVSLRLAEAEYPPAVPVAPDGGVSRRVADAKYQSAVPVAPAGGVSLRLADAKFPPAAQAGPHGGVSLRLADAEHPQLAEVRGTAARRGTARGLSGPDESSISVLGLVLSLTGVAVLAAGGAATVTLRTQRRHHSTA